MSLTQPILTEPGPGWHRVMTFGKKIQNGEEFDFTVETLGQCVDNFARVFSERRMGLDAEHQVLHAPENGQPAPQLGFYSGAALIENGVVLKHWDHYPDAPAPDPADLLARAQSKFPRMDSVDGLWCYLREVSPLGMDPERGLANYHQLSPFFAKKDSAEDGQPIGYALANISVVGVAFQDGTVIFSKAGTDRSEDPGVMVALYPPSDVAAQVTTLGGEPASDMHVTLAYLGRLSALPSDVMQRAGAAIASAVTNHAALAGSLGGIGRFPASTTSDGKDVIYLPVDVPGLVELRHDIVTALEAPSAEGPEVGTGIKIRRAHGFSPHMTLAYVEPGSPTPDPVQSIPVEFDRVALVCGTQRHDFHLATAAGAISMSKNTPMGTGSSGLHAPVPIENDKHAAQSAPPPSPGAIGMEDSAFYAKLGCEPGSSEMTAKMAAYMAETEDGPMVRKAMTAKMGEIMAKMGDETVTIQHDGDGDGVVKPPIVDADKDGMGAMSDADKAAMAGDPNYQIVWEKLQEAVRALQADKNNPQKQAEVRNWQAIQDKYLRGDLPHKFSTDEEKKAMAGQPEEVQAAYAALSKKDPKAAAAFARSLGQTPEQILNAQLLRRTEAAERKAAEASAMASSLIKKDRDSEMAAFRKWATDGGTDENGIPEPGRWEPEEIGALDALVSKVGISMAKDYVRKLPPRAAFGRLTEGGHPTGTKVLTPNALANDKGGTTFSALTKKKQQENPGMSLADAQRAVAKENPSLRAF